MENKKGFDTNQIITTLGELPSGALITEQNLAQIFDRHPASIKRAIRRGELPPPAKILGKPTWTAESILDHINALLHTAKGEKAELAHRLKKHAIE